MKIARRERGEKQNALINKLPPSAAMIFPHTTHGNASNGAYEIENQATQRPRNHQNRISTWSWYLLALKDHTNGAPIWR